MLYVGIDWANSYHQIFVTSDSAQKLASFSIVHGAEGFKQLLSKIRSLSKRSKDCFLPSKHLIIPWSNTFWIRDVWSIP